MTNETLAQYANLALYSAMVVFTLSMIYFAVDLARTAPAATDARTSARGQRALVGAGTGPGVPEASEPAEPPAPPRRKAASIGLVLFQLGTLLLTGSVVLRGLSVMRPPFGNMFEFACAGALAVCVGFLVLNARRDVRWLGVFVTLPVLLTLGLALTVFYTEASELVPSLKSVWLVIHVVVATLAVGVFTIAFCVVILQLIQARWEASKEPLTGLRARVSAALPGSRSLERTAYGLHVVAFPMWTFAVIAGAIWAQQAWGSYWNWDPKEVASFVVWVVYAAYLHARATSGWSRRASYLAIAGYACVVANFTVVNLFAVGQHSYSGV